LLEVSKSGSAPYTSLSDAISAARPGSAIEIADSGDYDPVTIHLNDDGIPLHGLTLRARQGMSPTIRGFDTVGGLMAVGVQGLTVEGISFRQVQTGLDLAQSTGVVTDCDVNLAGIGIVLEQSSFSLRDVRLTGSLAYGIAGFRSGLNMADSVIRETTGAG